MIGVIADDLTGAAETGAIGFRFGLEAEILTIPGIVTGTADFVVIDSDSRSCSPAQARGRVREAAEWMRDLGPAWVYKKVDSVLRGHVADELEVIAEVFGKNNSLLLPVNPSLGRVIREGRYLIKGRLAHETEFADDPEFPVRTSDVLRMLGPVSGGIAQLSEGDGPWPEKGIVIGNVEGPEDLRAFAGRLTENTLSAGGADFLAALLERRGCRLRRGEEEREGVALLGKSLLVCGSASSAALERIRRAEKDGIPVRAMPPFLMLEKIDPSELIEVWAEAVAAAFKNHPEVIVIIGQALSGNPEMPQKLTAYLSRLTMRVLRKIKIDHLLIEGGATASDVLRNLGWKYFKVTKEWAQGVVSMQLMGREGPAITVKPGSYAWPEEIWRRS